MKILTLKTLIAFGIANLIAWPITLEIMKRCDQGWACLFWIYSFIPTLELIAITLTVILLPLIAKLWPILIARIILIIIGLSPFFLILGLLLLQAINHYVSPQYLFFRKEEQVPIERLNQYQVTSTNSKEFLNKPFQLEKWQTYTDKENKYSIKYPPLLSPSINNDTKTVSFFFNNYKKIPSTNEKRGNEIAVIRILDAGNSTKLIEDDQSHEKTFVLNKLSVKETNYFYFVTLPNKKILVVSTGSNKFNSPYDSIRNVHFVDVILQTIVGTQ